MAILIDGYNLLHVTGIVGRAGSGLHGSREALLRFLAMAITPKELRDTTIVFDAAEAPPGLPRTVMHEGMTVRYASDYDSADALLEELIAAHHVPRSVTVVSSDHRVQRAAQRRRAPFVDSDVWFAELARKRNAARAANSPSPPRDVALSQNDVEYWLAEFGDVPEEPPARNVRKTAKKAKPKPTSDEPDVSNPFPPGYGEDLLRDGP
jgi:uncharacterized protein